MDTDRSAASTLVVGDDPERIAERLTAIEEGIDAAGAPVEDDPRETGPDGDAVEAVDCVVVDWWTGDPAADDSLSEVVASVRERWPEVPVVAVVDDRDAASEAIAAGVGDYLLGDVDGWERLLAERILDAAARRRVESGRDDDLQRLHSLASRRDADFEEKVEAVLELGRERYGVDIAFLSAIDHSFEVVAAKGDHPLIQAGTDAPLSQTYCRKAIADDEPLAVENAREEGWEGDVAYETYGLSCYLGAKVIVDGTLYGTLCFADTDAVRTFSAADRTLVDLMARWIGYEIERREYVEELRSQNERFEELARALSHDLGNILEVGRSHVEYAHATGDIDRLEDAMDAHDRAAELLKHTVQLTRAGQRIDETEAVDLGIVANDAWTHVGTDGTLDVRDDVAVEADRKRLLQLLENLFRNSVEHGASDGDPVAVRVGALADDQGFYVEDDGPGIDPENCRQVFEAGHSGDEDGTGLGLSIVEQIAKAHDWEVQVAEGTDGGARFEITGVDRPA